MEGFVDVGKSIIVGGYNIYTKNIICDSDKLIVW